MEARVNGQSNQVTFRTGFFQPRPEEEAATNPGRHGQALAQWMQQHLQARGVLTDAVVAEDFGWVVIVSRKPFLLWLGCGNTEDSADEWRIFPMAELSLFQRLLGRQNTALAVDELWQHVQAIVPEIPGVNRIRWE